MRRRLSNLLAALSLLAGIAVACLWVRSHWVFESITLCRQDQSGPEPRVTVVIIRSSSGRIITTVERVPPGTWPASGNTFEYFSRPEAYWNGLDGEGWLAEQMGFFRKPFRGNAYGIGRHSMFGFPTWCLGLPFASFLVVHLLIVRKTYVTKSRHRSGRCLECGYDLQGLPGLRPRCPECGTEVIAGCRVPSAE
jgi:hypothetical protein